MQAVFGLIENHRMRTIHDLVGDFLAAMRRQAVHKNGVGLGARHQPAVDLITLEQIVAASAVAVAHGYPSVGDDAVSAFYRLFRVGAERDRDAGGLDPIEQRFLWRQFGRRRHPQMEIKALRRVHP